MREIDPLEAVAIEMAEAVAILVTPHAEYSKEESEDICQITDIDPAEADSGECGFVAEVVEECSDIGRLDVVNYWERVIFCWVIGDISHNLLSYTLAEARGGVYALTPLLSLSPLTATSERETMLTINGKVRGISRKDFAEAALTASKSIKSRALNIIFNKLCAAQDRWKIIIATAEIAAETKGELIELFEERIGRLQG